VSIHSTTPPTGRDALTLRDDGSVVVPQTPTAWDEWVSAGRTRNYLDGEPLLDWLARYGEAAGFERDDELEGFDPRTDFLGFTFERGSTRSSCASTRSSRPTRLPRTP